MLIRPGNFTRFVLGIGILRHPQYLAQGFLRNVFVLSKSPNMMKYHTYHPKLVWLIWNSDIAFYLEFR